MGLLLLTVGFFWSQCVEIIHPHGMIAEKERNLLVFATLLMLIVVIPVFVLTFVFMWKYHKDNKKAKYDPEWNYSLTLEALWWGVPLVIIAVLSALTWTETHRLDPYRPIESDKEPLTIQVVALQWRWLFLYPEQEVATMGYFKFPVDRPVKFVITADAPMNSFWIPELGGQIYAMPKMQTVLHTITDRVGSYKGASANLSGKGFANMVFVAEAVEESDFDAWVVKARASDLLDWQRYRELAKPSEDTEMATYQLGEPHLFKKVMDQFLTPGGR
ncbi:MAG: ubiquinol oxidase subunit II [Chlamydiae bacterium]|nr:ubiquinol oxidase subunit II [Chlamydiota bacterium]